MIVEEYEWFRDQLLTISVQDPDRVLRRAAEECRNTMSPELQYKVVRLAEGSIYGQRLASLYADIVLMEAA